MTPSRSVAVLAALLGGCVTETQEPAGPAARRVDVRSPGVRPPAAPPSKPAAAPVGPDAVDTLTADQPCGNRLHSLAGDMLMYYALHRRLPPTLEDLRAIADDGAALEFTCPTSRQPYVYEPGGLTYPGKEERLVLYDAEPTHDGTRWGVVAAPPKGERPAAAWAVRLPEQLFRAYTTPPPPPPPAPAEPRPRRARPRPPPAR